MELSLDDFFNIQIKNGSHRQVVECGNWDLASELGVYDYAFENWDDQKIANWQQIKLDSQE